MDPPIFRVGKHSRTAIAFSQPDLLLSHFYVNGLADDSAPHFAWPVMVIIHRGIKCVDVFECLVAEWDEESAG